MLIPLNLPNDYDKALSIVSTKDEAFSVALVSIANGYRLDPLPSYDVLYNTTILNLLSSEDRFNNDTGLVVCFEKQLTKDENLYKALKDAMDIISNEYI